MKSRAISILFLLLYVVLASCRPGSHRESRLLQNPRYMEQDTLINRRPAVAGSFYPGNRAELMDELTEFFKHAIPSKKLERVEAIIVPHAGYVFSGQVAASAYNQLPVHYAYETIIVIGSSHRASYSGAAIYADGNFITPLGTARVNIPLAKKLLHDHPDLFNANRDVQLNEHSLEVQIPFLQYLYKDQFTFVPILLGTQNTEECRKLAEALRPYLNGKNLFIISTDFSHYPDYKSAIEVDNLTATAILQNSPEVFLKTLSRNENMGIDNLATSIWGWTSMLTFLYMTGGNRDFSYQRIQYMNSGDTPYGDKDRVVGYNAIVVTGKTIAGNKQATEFSLTGKEKEILLGIARKSIQYYLEKSATCPLQSKDYAGNLLLHAGAFVTLHEHGELRGCIGRFSSDEPLYKVIQEMALASAFNDSRFSPLEKSELSSIDIEISVLTPMVKIDSVNQIVLGRDGIYIKKGASSGTFLPQVATQTGWGLQEFLGHCARDKAGIGWDGWKDAEIYTYQAFIFGEKE